MDWSQYQILALAAIFEQNESYLFRKICRDYSTKFCTPLHEVHKLPFHFVLTNWMESKIESMNDDSIKELAQDIIGIDESEEALIQEQIKQWENDFVKKKPLKARKRVTLPEIEEKVLDFSDLENES